MNVIEPRNRISVGGSSVLGVSSLRGGILLHSCTRIDVRFYELDPYNHLNHTVYLAYCETARIEEMERRGIGMADLDRQGFRIVVASLAARFLAPARAGDRLEVVTDVVRVRRAGHDWRQRIERDGEVLFEAEIRAAMTGRDGRPVRVPDFVREALTT